MKGALTRRLRLPFANPSFRGGERPAGAVRGARGEELFARVGVADSRRFGTAERGCGGVGWRVNLARLEEESWVLGVGDWFSESSESVERVVEVRERRRLKGVFRVGGVVVVVDLRDLEDRGQGMAPVVWGVSFQFFFMTLVVVIDV